MHPFPTHRLFAGFPTRRSAPRSQRLRRIPEAALFSVSPFASELRHAGTRWEQGASRARRWSACPGHVATPPARKRKRSGACAHAWLASLA